MVLYKKGEGTDVCFPPSFVYDLWEASEKGSL